VNRVFAALNLRYDLEWSHVLSSDVWLQQSTLGISGAVTAQVEEGVFFGVGPTTYLQLSKNFAVSAALSIQVAGNAANVPGSLNLRDFERLQAQLRFEYNF
jgi:hypothetical protein